MQNKPCPLPTGTGRRRPAPDGTPRLTRVGPSVFFSPQVAALEEAVEELLGQLEAFCGLTEAVGVVSCRGVSRTGGHVGAGPAGPPS